ncbi:MAG: hypothetical protein WC073_04320 [Sterolibacterium sp.]
MQAQESLTPELPRQGRTANAVQPSSSSSSASSSSSIGTATLKFIAALNRFATATGDINTATHQQMRSMAELTDALHHTMDSIRTNFPGTSLSAQDSHFVR